MSSGLDKPSQLLRSASVFALVAWIVVFLCCSSVTAHPMGFGMVDVVLSPPNFHAELVLDSPPEALEPRSAAAEKAYVSELKDQIEQGFVLMFDDRPVPSEVTVLSVGTGPVAVDIARVSATMPKGARKLVISVATEIGDLGVEIRGGPLTRRLSGLVSKGENSPPIYLTEGAKNLDWASTSRMGASSANVNRKRPSTGQGTDRSAAVETATESSRRALDLGFVAMLRLGFRHIIPDGLDHVLFILGLLLLNSRRPGRFGWLRSLLLQLSIFTVSHSLTLALGALGYVQLDARWIEPLIALSIVYVGIEPLLPQRSTEAGVLSAVWRQRGVVVFLFGLLHGLGFASALSARGFSADTLVRSLFAFNIGVEAGQVLVAAGFAAVVFKLREHRDYFRFVVLPCGVLISGLGLVWLFERLT